MVLQSDVIVLQSDVIVLQRDVMVLQSDVTAQAVSPAVAGSVWLRAHRHCCPLTG